MPIYEYTCTECEHNFEILASVSDRNKAVESSCPSCGITGSVEMNFGIPGIGDGIKMGLPGCRDLGGMKEVFAKIKERTGQEVKSKFLG